MKKQSSNISHKFRRHFIGLLLFVAVFFNPVVLLLLFKNFWISCAILLTIIVGGLLLNRVKSFRLLVWAFNIFAIIGIFLNAELIFRQMYGEKDVPNIYEIKGKYYFNKPFLNQEFEDDEFLSHYLTNIQGYRIDELTSPNDSLKECDWLFIGDSFTQGAQVNYNEMFTSLLYRTFPDKIIVNAGMSGAGLYEVLNYLKDMGAQLKPKHIFLQIGAFNDFFNIREREAGWSEYLMEKSDLYRYIEYQILDNPTLPLGRWTEPFFDNPEENSKYNIFFKQSSPEKEADKAAFRKVLESFKKEAHALGADLTVMLIPSKEQISKEMLSEALRKFNIKESELDMEAPNKLTQATCSALDISLIDLTQSFREAQKFPFFIRDEHLSSAGHETTANAFISQMKKDNPSIHCFSNTNKNERYPTFFNDGQSVLFQSQDKDLYKIAISNTSHTREDLIWSSPKELIHPMISPDGSWLVFTQGDQNKGETNVILYNFTTQEEVLVNQRGFRGAIATFSPDSKYLVYPKWADGKNPVICLYDINNRKELLLIGEDLQENWRPEFSPDETSIYYLSMQEDGNFAIRKYDLHLKKDEEVFKTSFNIWDINISPDGERIVFAGNPDGNWDLFIYEIPSRKLTRLTKTLGDEWDPIFSPDGESIWYAGEYGINNGIYYFEQAKWPYSSSP